MSINNANNQLSQTRTDWQLGLNLSNLINTKNLDFATAALGARFGKDMTGISLAQKLYETLMANERASINSSASVEKPADINLMPGTESPLILANTLLAPIMTIGNDKVDISTKEGQAKAAQLNKDLVDKSMADVDSKSHGLNADKVGGYAQMAASAGTALQSFGKPPKDDTVQNINNATDKMADAAISSGNPYAMMAGAAVKVGGAINRMTGNGGVDGKTGMDKFMASDVGFITSNFAPLFPGLQSLYWINRLTAKSTPKFEVDRQLQADLGDGWAGAFKNLERDAGKAGVYGGLSSRKYNQAVFDIGQAKLRQERLGNINDANNDALIASAQEAYGLSNQTSLNGGVQTLKAGKNGMKLTNIKWANSVLDISRQGDIEKVEGGETIKENQYETIIPINLDSPQFLKEGGTFNVIPDGALHKNKHNMEDAEGLTKKGIPVVTEEDGKKIQQAEIEVNEIIFRLEVTEKLEKLAKEGTEEAAIEAGKLLVKEILHNTHDNTGLIDGISA